MSEYERIIFELVGKVSILETKLCVLEDKVARIEDHFESNAIVKETKNVGRDKTRYTLDGEIYLKNRFVWAVVEKYVKEHYDISFDILSSVFDDSLQGSFGVIRKIESVSRSKRIRYFGFDKKTLERNEKDIIHLKDCDIVVCNQWGIGNIGKIFNLAIKLGYSVEKK